MSFDPAQRNDSIDETSLLTNAELHARYEHLELERRRIEADLLTITGEIDARGAYSDDDHLSMNAFLRGTMNASAFHASEHASIGRLLRQYPEIRAAWRAGRIGWSQVARFKQLNGNSRIAEVLSEFIPTLLEHAEQLSYKDFDRVCKHFVALADPDGAHQDRDTAQQHRNAQVAANGDEADIFAVGGDPVTAAELVRIFRAYCEAEYRIDHDARKAEHGDDAPNHDLPRTAAQRRFDALVKIFRDAIANQGNGIAADVVVNLLIDSDTFNHVLGDAGLANEPEGDRLDTPETLLNRRCETEDGATLIDCDIIRAVLTGHIRKVVINSANRKVSFGRKRRLFAGAAGELVRLLTPGCEHRGCELPSDFCEVDHNIEFYEGGETEVGNSSLPCPPHNKVKHRKRWRFVTATNGVRYKIRQDGSVALPIGARRPAFPPAPATRHQVA